MSARAASWACCSVARRCASASCSAAWVAMRSWAARSVRSLSARCAASSAARRSRSPATRRCGRSARAARSAAAPPPRRHWRDRLRLRRPCCRSAIADSRRRRSATCSASRPSSSRTASALRAVSAASCSDRASRALRCSSRRPCSSTTTRSRSARSAVCAACSSASDCCALVWRSASWVRSLSGRAQLAGEVVARRRRLGEGAAHLAELGRDCIEALVEDAYVRAACSWSTPRSAAARSRSSRRVAAEAAPRSARPEASRAAPAPGRAAGSPAASPARGWRCGAAPSPTSWRVASSSCWRLPLSGAAPAPRRGWPGRVPLCRPRARPCRPAGRRLGPPDRLGDDLVRRHRAHPVLQHAHVVATIRQQERGGAAAPGGVAVDDVVEVGCSVPQCSRSSSTAG